jgi:CheY-like chemotaxis protein
MTQRKTRVLIVEDELALNEAYTRLLEAVGMKPLRAFNGKEALDVLERDTPDVILLDLRMPVMDGIEFLRSVQPAKRLPDTQIVVFSNYDNQSEIDHAFDLGATHYMLKAWATPNELVKLIRQARHKPSTA